MSGIQDDLTSPKDLPLSSYGNKTERVKERRINKEETKHLNRMDWIFLHLFKKDPYSLSLFLGTISREPLAEIQPDSAEPLIRALRGRPHARIQTGAHIETQSFYVVRLAFYRPPCPQSAACWRRKLVSLL